MTDTLQFKDEDELRQYLAAHPDLVAVEPAARALSANLKHQLQDIDTRLKRTNRVLFFFGSFCFVALLAAVVSLFFVSGFARAGLFAASVGAALTLSVTINRLFAGKRDRLMLQMTFERFQLALSFAESIPSETEKYRELIQQITSTFLKEPETPIGTADTPAKTLREFFVN